MSYCILVSPDHPLPTLISRQDIKFPEFICAGYSVADEGWKWEMEKRIEERTALICETLV